MHPFYRALINVLYSRDHFKLALGHLNTCVNRIEKIAKEYTQMLKHAESLYRCKTLKRAALGRMCTLVKKLNSSLMYLEQVRQHLSRLPTIDPRSRTVVVTGYPNVGKSSFLRKVSNADPDVQPYAFTTKVIYVGHTQYKGLPYQILDTPGLLDHPLDERNTIEMQAITALAHLQSIVLFFFDISEECGYSIEKQVALYNSVKPLFTNKPLMFVMTKTDLQPWETLDMEKKNLILEIAQERDVEIVSMSTVSEDGVDNVKNTACQRLLTHRVATKGKKLDTRGDDVLNRINVAFPERRDNVARPAFIPESVRRRRQAMETGQKPAHRKLERDIELEHGGPGVYSHDHTKNYVLAHDDYKLDVVPEFYDGHNVADWLDPDLDERLAELEEEEAEIVATIMDTGDDDDEPVLNAEEQDLYDRVIKKKTEVMAESKSRKSRNHPIAPRKIVIKKRSFDRVVNHLKSMGLSSAVENLRARSRKRRATSLVAPRDKSKSRARSQSRGLVEDGKVANRREDGLGRSVRRKIVAERVARKAQKPRNRDARMGEGDRHHYEEMPKHLFTGKRGIGKTDWR
jgi:nucleolar GTP-binding protein